MRLKDKHIVVTGSGRGIGRALAQSLAAEGGRITCVDINGEAAADTARVIQSNNGQSASVTCDTTKFSEVETSLRQGVEKFGPVSVLVANAGGAAGNRTAFLDLTEISWKEMIDRNLTGSFHCGLVYGKHLAANGGGAIVFITSLAAEISPRELTHYAAAKAGIKQLMRGMAVELAPYHVRVNAVAPGVVLTEGNRDIIMQPKAKAEFERTIPLGRYAEANELAGAVIYLASDESTYTTGATILVDGGAALI